MLFSAALNYLLCAVLFPNDLDEYDVFAVANLLYQVPFIVRLYDVIQ